MSEQLGRRAGNAQLAWEALELPGEPMDYHFVLQQAVSDLWAARRTDPGGLETLETFARLDLALMEAAPEAVSFDHSPPEQPFVRVTSVSRLITLLEREGAVAEALEVSRRLNRFRQGEDVTARLAEKAEGLAVEGSWERMR
ncbi:hypothetical protein RB196_34450 [Streptomyces sp. PmtA]|uniref:hypothetical protein n=1 Tax=Streptomyces sp. PmtA TaxID=3074275 RepID=UPI003014469A